MSDARTPLIVVAQLQPAVQARLEGLRRAHYPPQMNRVPAHCTVFHAVPGMVADELARVLARLAAATRPPPARLDRVIDLDGGTAIAIASEAMIALRETIAEHFHGMLHGADALPARLHVTIQNKVERRTAHALQRELAATWRPVDTAFAGLAAHRVRDGLWQAAGEWRFRG